MRAPAAQANANDDVTDARQWLLEGAACQKSNDIPGAVQAFRIASFLYRDAGKKPQARAALKVAIRLAPYDDYLLSELRLFEPRTQPAEAEPPALADSSEMPTRRLTLEEWGKLFQGAEDDELSIDMSDLPGSNLPDDEPLATRLPAPRHLQ